MLIASLGSPKTNEIYSKILGGNIVTLSSDKFKFRSNPRFLANRSSWEDSYTN